MPDSLEQLQQQRTDIVRQIGELGDLAPVRSPAPRGVAANQAAAAIAPVNRGTVPIPASPIRPVVRPSPSRCRLRPRWAKPSAKWPSSASSSN